MLIERMRKRLAADTNFHQALPPIPSRQEWRLHCRMPAAPGPPWSAVDYPPLIEEAKVRLRESWPLRRNPTDTSETISLLARRWLHPCFESVIPALFWARLDRGAAVHGLRSPGSAFGFGTEIHRLRRSHPSIPSTVYVRFVPELTQYPMHHLP